MLSSMSALGHLGGGLGLPQFQGLGALGGVGGLGGLNLGSLGANPNMPNMAGQGLNAPKGFPPQGMGGGLGGMMPNMQSLQALQALQSLGNFFINFQVELCLEDLEDYKTLSLVIM